MKKQSMNTWKLLRNLLFGILVLGVTLISFAFAIPSGPGSITPISSGRYGTTGAQNASAIAGNVTELNFAATSITQTWQGYFGNITGNIVLGDANNKTFYNWNSANPYGEIYATRTATTPTWSLIQCANITHVNTEETALGINQSVDVDSVNRTFIFNTTTFDQFYVGPVNINSSQNCFATRLYNASGVASQTDFAEVLLYDNSSLIYTGLIEQDALGFDNRTHDFQMLVGENGHSGDTTVSTYYFYVELG